MRPAMSSRVLHLPAVTVLHPVLTVPIAAIADRVSVGDRTLIVPVSTAQATIITTGRGGTNIKIQRFKDSKSQKVKDFACV